MMPAADVRLEAARARLLRELTSLTGAAAASALERCPYRDRADACTFGHGCRNRRRQGAGWRCAGGSLVIAPASPERAAP